MRKLGEHSDVLQTSRANPVKWHSTHNKSNVFFTLQQYKHILTHCSTLQPTATHYSTLQHAATHCNTLQHTATRCRKCVPPPPRTFWPSPSASSHAPHFSTLQHTAAHCNTLQHTATYCNTLQYLF